MIRKLLYFVRSLFLNFSNSSKERSFRPSLGLLCLGMFFMVSYANAATYYSRVSGNFGLASTWSTSPSGSPTNGTTLMNADIFIIQSGHTVTVAANQIVAAVTINSGGTLIVGGFNFTVSGLTSISGALTHNSATGTKNFTGDVTINSGGTWNETVAEAITFGGSLANNGTFTTSTGAHTFSGGTKTFSGLNNITIPNVAISGTYTNNGDLTISNSLTGGGTLANSSGSTVVIGGTTNSTITNFSNAGTAVINASANITTALANFVNTSAGTLNLNGTGTITGITNNGTVNLASGTITSFNNATVASVLNITAVSPSITTLTTAIAGNTVNYNGAGQSIKGNAYSNLKLSNSGIKTLGGATTVNSVLTLNNNVSLDMSTNLLTLNGDLINIGTGTVSGTTGGVTISGSTSQNIAGFTTTGNVTMSKSGNIATLTGAVNGANLTMSGTGGSSLALGAFTHTFTGNWAMNAATLIANSSTLRVQGDLTGGGNFTSGTGTVELYGANQSITQPSFNNLSLTGSGVKTFMLATTIGNNLSIASNVVANLGTIKTHSANSIILGGVTTLSGSWGSTSSTANNQNDTFFASTTGLINVTSPSCTVPTIFAMTGASQAYCSTDAGSTIGLNGSESGVTYRLYRGTVAVGSPVSGTGTPITFGAFNTTGKYTVLASRSALCTATMSGGPITILKYSSPPTITGTVGNVACPTDATGTINITNISTPASLAFLRADTDGVDFGQQMLSGKAAFTVEGWIKFDGLNYVSRMSIFGQNNAIEIAFEQDNLRCWTSGGGSVDMPKSEITAGIWYHIAVTGDGTNLKIYLNGNLKATAGTATTNYGSSTETTKIGYAVMDASGNGLTGEIFKVGFWNTALTATDIAKMAAGFVEYDASLTGLIAGYSFNDGPGATTISGVGSSAPTGTLLNPPKWTDPYVYSWTSTPAGYTSSGKNLTNLSPKTYNVKTSLGNCTSTASFTVSATKIATGITTQSTAAQTQCLGGTFSPITVTAAGTALNYQWYRNTSASTTGATSLVALNGAQTNSYTPQSTTVGTLYYYCVVTGDCGTVTSGFSGAFVTTPATVISAQSTTGQTKCESIAYSPITVTATGTAPVSYQWYSNTSASTVGATDLGAPNGAQTNSYTPQSTIAGTLYYYCIVTGGCGSVTSGFSGAFVTTPATVISAQSTAGQTKCVSIAYSPITVTATGTAPVSYQWYSNSSASTTGATNLGAPNGAQTNSYTPQSTTVGTLYYYCIVTGGCSSVTSGFSGAFVTTPVTVISAQSTAGQTKCESIAYSPITVTATGTAPVSYQWYSNTSASTTGATNLGAPNGAQTNSYTPQSTIAGTLYYYCIVTGGCGSVTSGFSGAFVTTPATVVSAQSTAGQTKCVSIAYSPITVTATGTAPVSYQWYSNSSASTTGATNLGAPNGAQTNSYTPQSTIVGTLYYYCIVTGGCGSVTSGFSGAFVTTPATVISAQSTAGQTKCVSIAYSPITVTATGTAPVSYQWYSNTSASTTGATNLGAPNGAQTNSYTPQSTIAGTLYYYCIVTGSCGSVTSGFSGIFVTNSPPITPTASVTTQPTCAVPTGVITITNPAPASGISYSIDGSDYSNTSGVFNGVAIGSYNVTVKNSSLCISSPTPISVNAAASKVWTGATDTNWSVATNWSPNGVPTASDCVLIPDLTLIANKPAIAGTNGNYDAYTLIVNDKASLIVGTTNTIKVVNAVTVLGTGSLTFENHASLLQTNTGNNINTGNITYKRSTEPVRRYDFTYWSSPVTKTPGFSLYDLSPNTLSDKYYSYNPASGWVISDNGTQIMKQANGYIVRAPQYFDLNNTAIYDAAFIGVPNNGTITVIPTSTKWNLIGNPYPSGLDGKKFIEDNAALGVNVGALYFWTHNTPPKDTAPGDYKYNYTSNDYAVYSLVGGVSTGAKTPTGVDPTPTGKIAAGQAFFMKANGPVGQVVTFTNDMRLVGENNQFFKASNTNNTERSRIWLNITNTQGAFKQALIGYLDGASNDWDVNYDGPTLNGNTYLDFYSINDSKKLTIQGRALPFLDTDQVPLGYKTTVAGDFTIAIDHVDGLFDKQVIYLEDKTTGIVTDLRAGNYTFTTAIGTFVDRFTLSYTKKTLGTGDFENLENSVFVSIKEKAIKVTSTKETIKEVTIYDITGNLLYNKKKVGTAELQIPNLQSSNQVLLVKVTLENDYTTTKKIIFQ